MALSALVELLELLPTPVEVDMVGFKALENFQAITILLQRDGISFTEVRSIFSVLVQDFAEMEQHHLGTESCLVVNPDFEMGIMRIFKGMPLTLEQQAAVSALASIDQGGQEWDDEDGFDDGNVNESYAVRVVKRLKLEDWQTVKQRPLRKS